MVRQSHPNPEAGWAARPVPLLVVEIISPSTRRRDQEQKKSLYMVAGVAEYWIVDPDARSIRVVRPGEAECVERERVEWQPPGVTGALTIPVDRVVCGT
jgi:Uma2 family endonuclease